MINNICIYRHITLDTNEIFYIGIGNIKRPYSKHNRNKYWKNIVNKHGYEIQILKSDLTWENACELEKFLISWYGRQDNNTGILINMTDGGDGTLGIKKQFPEHLKENVKIRMLNNKYLLGHIHSNETKNKISNSLKGRIVSENTRIKLSLLKLNKSNDKILNRKHSNEELSKMINRDLLLDNKEITIILDLETGIFYTIKDLSKLLNISTYKIRKIIKLNLNNKFILT